MKYILLLLIYFAVAYTFCPQPFSYLMSNVDIDGGERKKKSKHFSLHFLHKPFVLHMAVMIIYGPSLLPKMLPTNLPHI